MIMHGDALLIDRDIDRFTEAHHVFINGVVQDLFQKDVNTIVIRCTIAQLPDIHPRAAADMLLPLKGNYVFFLIIVLQYL